MATDEHGVSTSSHGSLEKGWDFTTIINNPPYAPTGPTPALGATDQSTTGLRLSWTGGDPDGDRVTYVVSYGTYSALSLTDLPSTSNTYVTLPTLEFGTRYRWKVVATDEHGVSTNSHGILDKGWDFTTVPPSNYVSFDIIDNSISRHFAGNVNLKIYESPTNWYTVLFDQISLPGSPLSWYDVSIRRSTCCPIREPVLTFRAKTHAK